MAAQLTARPRWESPYERSFQLRKTLEDSRKAFLNFAEDKEEKRPPAKKISFKIKKTSSLYRRKEKISVNTVQELAKKYNELVERSEQPNRMRIVVKKEVVARKPSLKKRPSDGGAKVARKPSSVSRKLIANKDISKLEMEGGVKAAIAIFEERINTPQIAPKPKVPEKTFNAKDLASRNHEKRLKIFEKRLRSFNNNNNEKEKADGEFFVQVVNIPLSPPKKCDSKYETMHLRKANLLTKDEDSPNADGFRKVQTRLQEAGPNERKVIAQIHNNSPNQVQLRQIHKRLHAREDPSKDQHERPTNKPTSKELASRQNSIEKDRDKTRTEHKQSGMKKIVIPRQETQRKINDRINSQRVENDKQRSIPQVSKQSTSDEIVREVKEWIEEKTKEYTPAEQGNPTKKKLQRTRNFVETTEDSIQSMNTEDSSIHNGHAPSSRENASIINENASRNNVNSPRENENSSITNASINHVDASTNNVYSSRSNENASINNEKSSARIEYASINEVHVSSNNENASITHENTDEPIYEVPKMLISKDPKLDKLKTSVITSKRAPLNRENAYDSLDGVNNTKNLESKVYEDVKLKMNEDPAKSAKKTLMKMDRRKSENPKDPRNLIARIIGKREKLHDRRKSSDAKFYDLEHLKPPSENKPSNVKSNVVNIEIGGEKNADSCNSVSSLSMVNGNSGDLRLKQCNPSEIFAKVGKMEDKDANTGISREGEFQANNGSNNKDSDDFSKENGFHRNTAISESNNKDCIDVGSKNGLQTNTTNSGKYSNDVSRVSGFQTNTTNSGSNNKSSNDVSGKNGFQATTKNAGSNDKDSNCLQATLGSVDKDAIREINAPTNNKTNEESSDESTKSKDLIYSKCPERTKDDRKPELIGKLAGVKKANIASSIRARVHQLELIETKNTFLKTNKINVDDEGNNSKCVLSNKFTCKDSKAAKSCNKEQVQNGEMDERAMKIYKEILIENLERKNAKENGFHAEKIYEERVIEKSVSDEYASRRKESIYETLREAKGVVKSSEYEKAVLLSDTKVYEAARSEMLDDYEECADESKVVSEPDWEDLYDFVDVNVKPTTPTPTNEQPPSIPPRRIKEEKIYEELIHATHDYEDDGYEICESPSSLFPEENIYETLPTPPRQNPPVLPRRKEEPLPPRPPSRNGSSSAREIESNFYESIYSRKEDDAESTYESIYGCRLGLDQWKSKRDSLISEQQSNSIYNRSITSWAEEVFDYAAKNGSELSGSDRSDDWVDMSDNEDAVKNSGFIILKERQKVGKRVSGWSQQMRDQWNKIPRNTNLNHGDSDSDHHYETLSALNNPMVNLVIQDDEFDSFDSDSESDNSFAKNDSGVDMGNTQLPEPPNQQTYVHRLAATAGKHMKKWRNWTLTKNDITKTLGRMTKRKSRTDLDGIDKIIEEKSTAPSIPSDYEPSLEYQEARCRDSTASAYQNVQFTSQEHQQTEPSGDKAKTVGRKGFLNKFRRSMSISGETPELGLTSDHKAKSTFYLTETIDVDKADEEKEAPAEVPVVNLSIKNKTSPTRPRVPPPPAPKLNSPNLDIKKKHNTKRATSWYSECGVFKNAEPPPVLPRRPNTFWYAEVGLYRSTNNSTPSTSSTENSGSLNEVIIKRAIREDDDSYYNVRNENDYYNGGSVQSSDSYDTKRDEAFNSLPGESQLRLQDEPLYQFYDAAVLESVCKDGTTDFEYDGYEEVGKKHQTEVRLTTRPSAMELVAPKRNNVSVARTLWCEIPEVIQSTVLSTLNVLQKKLQEAKFEMLTSEASYLNSLNVLTDHFIKTFETCDFLNQDEKDILFGKVVPVKECSEKLLNELEKCWQDNILLHGICDIVKKHAEENFYVYVSYCENQILLDRTLRKLKERPGFVETLKQLESSTVCHLLTLHSFLMLPMQRVTRWPLLLDAVLKRLSHQDEEYLSCQYALATLNKIVNQCNEGARRMERVTEMKKIASQMEFGKGVTPISLVTGSRWLVRSGPLIQMQARGEDVKLTFGKRFSKVPLHLFLFNDILIVAKCRGDETYIIQHYCYRSYLEINSETLSCLPLKDTQGRHLIFVTILENHEEKTIELLLSCNSETDKERWMEALSPPKSENPDETLYECWDCPQVTAVHTYPANQPDELALSRGDIINVTRKMADGWYHGERIRDGETGWFPANYTVEVANPHVRARNLKQRYRLLAFSESYLKSK